MIRLHLTRGDNPAVVSLQLPATPADIGEAYAQLNTISTGRPPEIKDVESPIRNIRSEEHTSELQSHLT